MEILVYTAPEKVPSLLEFEENLRIFLAGTIDMGESIDWQREFIEKLKALKSDKIVSVLNPRRENWDSSWKQTITDPQFNEQVNWELNGLEDSDLVVMYIAKDSKSPITLLELGLCANGNSSIIVCCEEGFYRKGNIEILCHNYSIPLFSNMEDMWRFIVERELEEEL